jgi:hypothetical protein
LDGKGAIEEVVNGIGGIFSKRKHVNYLILSKKIKYSLQPILLFTYTDVSDTNMCLDTSVFTKGNMDQRKYSLRLILYFKNMNVSRHILVQDTYRIHER